MTYHLRDIKKGTLGELSNVAEEQGVRIMLLVELSDLIGAIKTVAEKNGSSLEDLLAMQKVTERAFKSGARK